MSIESVPDEVWNDAWKIVYNSLENYPEDYWASVGEDYDLNLWTEDDTSKKRASLFRVYDGKTSTLDEDCVEMAVDEVV